MATKELIRESIPTALFAPPGSLNRVTGSRGGFRHYEHGGTGAKLISVTTILGEAVRKKGVEWSQDSHIRKTLRSHIGDKVTEPMVQEVMKASNKAWKKAADIGTTVHDAIDGYLKGNEEAIDVSILSFPRSWPSCDGRTSIPGGNTLSPKRRCSSRARQAMQGR